MKRVDYIITDKQWRVLRKLAKNTGLKLSELIRQAIDKTYIHGEKKI